MIQTEKYVRKPFYVEAIRVTEENFSEVATWCNGEIREDDKGGRYIHVRVHRPLNPRQTQAYIGDWVLYSGNGYKVYVDKSFEKSFTSVWEDEKRPSFISPRHAMETIHNAAQPVQTAGEIVAELDAEVAVSPGQLNLLDDNREQLGDDELQAMGLPRSIDPDYTPVYRDELV